LKKEYFCFMQQKVKQFVAEHDLIVKHQTTVLAVSGGIDSVVMAHVFQQLMFPFEIAHCNFSLRGAASDSDEQFVRSLAQGFGVMLHVRKFDTEKFAKTHRLSVQMAARELRYDWFDELTRRKNTRIATAHHQGDVIETVIFNLTKGTGIAGLHGIRPLAGNLIRPLLLLTKEDIRDYAGQNSIEWREDASNKSVKYSRNLIRHEVIPILKGINPSLEKSFMKSVQRIKDSEDFLLHQINQLKDELVSEQNGNLLIERQRIAKLPGYVTVLHELIKEFGFNYDQARAMMAVHEQPGALFYSTNYVLNVDRDYFIISPVSINSVNVLVHQHTDSVKLMGGRLEIEEIEASSLTMESSSDIAYLDKDKLVFPLKVRTWQEGDSFYPLGLGGKKKLSDFMIDSKIALNLKRSVLVLVSGNEIVWVVGHRTDERYKIVRNTKHVYKVVFIKE
jgi:tRNA(Ile)-lysidine synthase